VILSDLGVDPPTPPFLHCSRSPRFISAHPRGPPPARKPGRGDRRRATTIRSRLFLGFGANAVCPYGAYEAARRWSLESSRSPRAATPERSAA
jgi:hypothetical protein